MNGERIRSAELSEWEAQQLREKWSLWTTFGYLSSPGVVIFGKTMVPEIAYDVQVHGLGKFEDGPVYWTYRMPEQWVTEPMPHLGRYIT